MGSDNDKSRTTTTALLSVALFKLRSSYYYLPQLCIFLALLGFGRRHYDITTSSSIFASGDDDGSNGDSYNNLDVNDRVSVARMKMYEKNRRQIGFDDACYVLDKLSDKEQDSDYKYNMYVGRCAYEYTTHRPSLTGGFYKKAIDWYHQRGSSSDDEVENVNAQDVGEACINYCLDNGISQRDLKKNGQTLLIEASSQGLVHVVSKLMIDYKLDPLETIGNEGSLNAIQEAIRGGYANVVSQLLGGQDIDDLPIDNLGRTIEDYITLKGSPIRPFDALKYLGIDTHQDQQSTTILPPHNDDDSSDSSSRYGNIDMGWNTKTSFPISNKCDIDVLESGQLSREQFYNEYWITGRPFVLKEATPKTELINFNKQRWSQTQHFNTKKRDKKVGPTAYPSLTGQDYCPRLFSIEEIEYGTTCPTLGPNIPMVHAKHPDKEPPAYLWELYPAYNGNILHKNAGWYPILSKFFTNEHLTDGYNSEDNSEDEYYNFSWQVFFGGDTSGATLHYHDAAFNTLYVGIKEWILTPPSYRGWTGMPAIQAANLIDHDISLKCTQYPGDLMFIPNNWGHLTINHGFSIGAAVIIPPNFQATASAEVEGATTVGSRSSTHEDDEEDSGEGDGSDSDADDGEDSTDNDNDDNDNSSEEQEQQEVMFVHINKTGGTSIIRMLQERCDDNVYRSEVWNDSYNMRGGYYNRRLQQRTFHATAQSLIEHRGRTAWNSAYTFAIVRHPLARMVSNFFFLMDQCNPNESEDSSDTIDQICQERLIPSGIDLEDVSDTTKIDLFHTYIKKLYKEYPIGHPQHYIFGSHGHGNERFEKFNATQTSWLVDSNDQIVVKHIYKFEDLIEASGGDGNGVGQLMNDVPCLMSSSEDDSRGNGGSDSVDEQQQRKMVKSSSSSSSQFQLLDLNKTPNYPHYTKFQANTNTNLIMKKVFDVDYKNFGYEY